MSQMQNMVKSSWRSTNKKRVLHAFRKAGDIEYVDDRAECEIYEETRQGRRGLEDNQP